ncbi:FG-GAP-like repeat-containing protein [Streptomyces sp. NPDC058739]|uniref:FG-GAP-like repeat-containing protein n=1 Tax=Streptomyces sp. NPDC058739 TaxID=3346618 RepID=UPI0036A418DC
MRISPLRRLAALATTLGLASLGLLGTGAAPAQAAIRDCPSGYFCAWKSEDGTGTMFKTNVNKATLGTWDNSFRTVVNHTSQYVCLHDDPNYAEAGGAYVWAPDPAGTEWGHAYATASSVRFVRTERECHYPAYPSWYSAATPEAAGFGDLNGDRKADVLVRDKAGRLWFLPGNRTGKLIGSGGWNSMNALTRHGDFSRDGREDLIAREAATGKLWLYPGTSTGTFGSRRLIGSGGWNSMSRIHAFGDLTGDSRSDLIAVEKATGKLWLYPGTSTGTLGARKLIGSGGWNSMNALVAVGDVNGDARPDLYAREAATGKLWLYPGRTAALGARTLVGSTGWKVVSEFVGVGDVTGDARADLVTTSTSGYIGETCRGVGCQITRPGRGDGTLDPGEVSDPYWFGLNGTF